MIIMDFILVAETTSKFGSGLFLLVQVVLLLDFVHRWNDTWVGYDEQFWLVLAIKSSMIVFLSWHYINDWDFVVSFFMQVCCSVCCFTCLLCGHICILRSSLSLVHAIWIWLWNQYLFHYYNPDFCISFCTCCFASCSKLI